MALKDYMAADGGPWPEILSPGIAGPATETIEEGASGAAG